MEASSIVSSFPQVPSPSSSSSSTVSRTRFPSPGPVVSLPLRHKPASGLFQRQILRCAKEGGGARSQIEKKLMENELEMEEDLMEMRKLSDKCGGIGGIAEVLECLEREAIMGEDVGRHPTDYNRRAQIFDKSSRVFQALKQQHTTPTTSPSAAGST